MSQDFPRWAALDSLYTWRKPFAEFDPPNISERSGPAWFPSPMRGRRFFGYCMPQVALTCRQMGYI